MNKALAPKYLSKQKFEEWKAVGEYYSAFPGLRAFHIVAYHTLESCSLMFKEDNLVKKTKFWRTFQRQIFPNSKISFQMTFYSGKAENVG